MHFIRRSRTHSLQLVTALALLVVAPECLAALGGDASALATQQNLLATPITVTRTKLFSVHALTTSSGVHIRQYADASGLVFAVAWDGPVLPDLEALLGASFGAYQDGQRQRARGVHILTPALVVESTGMMRAFVGKALLPERLPENVSARDIQ